jgi:hypothetical protein
MIAVRLRTRDGLERISISPDATLGLLRELISQKVERGVDRFIISTDQTLVRLRI